MPEDSTMNKKQGYLCIVPCFDAILIAKLDIPPQTCIDTGSSIEHIPFFVYHLRHESVM